MTFAFPPDYRLDIAPVSSRCAGASCEPEFWQRVDFYFSAEPTSVSAEGLADWIRGKPAVSEHGLSRGSPGPRRPLGIPIAAPL